MTNEQLIQNYKLISKMINCKDKNEYDTLSNKYTEPYEIKKSRSIYKTLKLQRNLSTNFYCFILFVFGLYSFQIYKIKED